MLYIFFMSFCLEVSFGCLIESVVILLNWIIFVCDINIFLKFGVMKMCFLNFIVFFIILFFKFLFIFE